MPTPPPCTLIALIGPPAQKLFHFKLLVRAHPTPCTLITLIVPPAQELFRFNCLRTADGGPRTANKFLPLGGKPCWKYGEHAIRNYICAYFDSLRCGAAVSTSTPHRSASWSPCSSRSRRWLCARSSQDQPLRVCPPSRGTCWTTEAPRGWGTSRSVWY